MGGKSWNALQKLFLDKDGLRGIWAALLFYAAVTWMVKLCSGLVHLAPIMHLIHSWSGMGGLTPHYLFVLELPRAVGALVVTAFIARLQRRRWTSYGFDYGPGSRETKFRALKNLAYGSVCGFACLTALILLLRAFHAISFDGLLLGFGAAVRYGALWACANLLVGVFEETTTRGCLVVTLGQPLSYWGASVIAALWFAQLHSANAGENVLGLIQVAVFSLLASWSFYRTGTLFWAIGFHAFWNWTQVFLFGTIGSGVSFKDGLMSSHAVGNPLLSGGGAGPEGSVLVLPVFAVAALMVFAMKPGRVTMQRDTALEPAQRGLSSNGLAP
jgi:membrane protease YdiL (CAAX protease family)